MERTERTLPSRAVRNVFVTAIWLSFISTAISQQPAVMWSVPAHVVTNNSLIHVWLNVLNISSADVAWKFPARVECKLTVEENATTTPVVRGTGDTEKVPIAAGKFAREEYVLTIPASIYGRVMVELPNTDQGPFVLNVQRQTVTGAGQKQPSFLAMAMKEAEPLAPGKPFNPGRFFREHVSGYEPLYFIAGTESPNAKFQISFKYQLLNSEGPLAKAAPPLKGFHVAYTQTSLWDWNAPSAPFFDSSYKPEVLYLYEKLLGGEETNWFRLDVQVGLQHESNGKNDFDSRSLNIAYFRPTLIIGRDGSFQVKVQPRAWVYVGDLSDNPDIADYRGYADLRVVAGWQRGLQASALGRLGEEGKGSVQVDVTYPLMGWFPRSLSLYLHAQYFTGYGESLLRYNRRDESFRIGFSLFR